MKIKIYRFVIVLIMLMSIMGCGKMSSDTVKNINTDISNELSYDSTLDPSYAEGFRVDYYSEGARLITINGEEQYLIVPKNLSDIEITDKNITIIPMPEDDIYVVASSVMDMLIKLDALDRVRFSALNKADWSINEAVSAMEDGEIIYAGKYSAPDYELLIKEGCSLAIENTMIYHNPKVKEELNSFNIPVLVDYSSYEKNPLGRMEWIKVYGAILGLDDMADKVFEKKKDEYLSCGNIEKTENKVVFFYMTKAGLCNVRKSDDYLPRMIEQGGGEYIFTDLVDDMATSSVNMQLEKFYQSAKDADYIIYNSTIEGEIKSLSDFTNLNPMFSGFKAVKNGNVFCTTGNFYQSTMELSTFVRDVDCMLSGDLDSMEFIYELK